jgi:hypothetical protein
MLRDAVASLDTTLSRPFADQVPMLADLIDAQLNCCIACGAVVCALTGGPLPDDDPEVVRFSGLRAQAGVRLRRLRS